MKTKQLLILGFIAFLSALEAYASTPELSGGNVIGEQGGTASLDVRLTNTSPLRDFQMYLRLPEGISVQTDSQGNLVLNVNKDLAPYHTGIANYHEGLYKMVVAAPQDAPILSDGEVLVSIPLVLDAPVGTYTYEFNTVYASQDIDGIVSNVPFDNFGGFITIEPPVVIDDFQFYNKKKMLPAGTTSAVLGIGFKNSEAVKAFAFDLELPAGISPVFNDEADDYVDYGDRIPTRFDVYSELTDNTLSIEGATTRSTTVAAGDDVLLTVNLQMELAPGTYPIIYKNQTVTLSDGTDIDVADFTGYIVIESDQTDGYNTITFVNEALTSTTPSNIVAMEEGEFVANEIALTDGYDLTIAEGFTAKSVSYSREFLYSVWQPMYVPYNMAYEEWAEIGTMAELTSAEVNAEGQRTLHWTTVTEGCLMPNHPYIFKPYDVGEFVFSGENKQFAATSDIDDVVLTADGDTYTISGVYTAKDDMHSCGAYGIAPDGNFKLASSDAVVLRPFRIYLMINGPVMAAPAVRNIIDGMGTSGVDGISDDSADSIYFDIMGREVKHPSRGFYIKDGNVRFIK